MIGDPPVLTLRRNFERPSAAQIAAFAGVPTGFVVDAQMGQGAVDHRIKPLWPESAFAAPALTAKCGPRDNMAVWIAMRLAKPGDVLVLAAPWIGTGLTYLIRRAWPHEVMSNE